MIERAFDEVGRWMAITEDVARGRPDWKFPSRYKLLVLAYPFMWLVEWPLGLAVLIGDRFK